MTPNHEKLGNLSQKYKGLGMKSRMRQRGYASRRKMEWKYFVTKTMLKTQYAQSGQRTKTKLEKRCKWLKISSSQEGRVGEWRRLAATPVRKDKARMGSSRTFATLPQATRGTMWKRGVACVPRQLPRKRSTSQISHTSPSKKKAQFNSTPSSPQIAFRYTNLLQGPRMSP